MRDWHKDLNMLPWLQTGLDAVSSTASGSTLVKSAYDAYLAAYGGNRNRNGRIFEGLILESLFRLGVSPVYYQATVRFIPSVKYDILLYHPTTPVALSCKTSLRERWKQADLEALALKQVYRGARSYLITMNESEGNRIQRKVTAAEVVGLNECVVVGASGNRFDHLLQELSGIKFEEAQAVIPVHGRVVGAASA